MAARADLPDINVWLALAVEDHEFHERARHYWIHEAGGTLAFCNLTALGLLRLVTNRTVMAGRPFSPAEAWAAYTAFRGLPEIVLLPEPAGCHETLGSWVALGVLTGKLWNDAYLAAFARSGDLRLVSFDSDFVRFEGFARLNLKP